VVKALKDIFRQSMDTGVVDDSMKEAYVSPIWKGRDRTQPSCYQPVALTSHLSKLMERLVRLAIVTYMEAGGLIDESQHGARRGQSTLRQLLLQYDQVFRLLENSDNAEVIYLDFSKAFDKVNLGLLQKIKKLEITGMLGT
jgi:hypothetical protein